MHQASTVLKEDWIKSGATKTKNMILRSASALNYKTRPEVKEQIDTDEKVDLVTEVL